MHLQVAESEEFSMLPLSQLIEIISNDELNVRTEEQVFKAVMLWVRTNVPERAKVMQQVISKARLEFQTGYRCYNTFVCRS